MANAEGLATAAVALEEHEKEQSPRFTNSNSDENVKSTKVENSANTSTNHLQPTTPNKKRPFSFGKKEKVLPKSDSRSDDGTNTTATKTGDAADGNGKAKNGAKDATPVQLVPFFALYRFHKPAEIFFNSIGLVCAFASGAAQVSRDQSTLLPQLSNPPFSH